MTQLTIYRIQEVCDRTGLKPSTIYKLIREKNFPKGVRLTSRSTGWSSHLVDMWISERVGSL